MTDTYSSRLNEALISLHSQLFDANVLKSKYSAFVDCPVCASHLNESYCIKDGFRHVQCKGCELIFLSPRLNQNATLEFYNSPANEVYNERKFNAFPNRMSPDDEINRANARMISELMSSTRDKELASLSGKKVLEIGSAKGFFLGCMRDLGADTSGVELNKLNAEYARKYRNLVIHDEDLFDLKFPDNSFDIIYFRDVIEHIHNPIQFLNEISRILNLGGMVFIETHNVDGYIHKLVRGKHTCIFGFEHPVHWSPKTLTLALEKSGLFVKEIYFSSEDFLPLNIINYFKSSTWTTIFPWQASGVKLFLLRLIGLPFKFPAINNLFKFVMPTFANYMRAGSTMKIVAYKK